MDCLVAYYMVDTKWNGVITKANYVHCIKHLLKIKEWTEEKIDRVWSNLLLSKEITQKVYAEYLAPKETSNDDGSDDDDAKKQEDKVKYDAQSDKMLTIVDFINGLNLTKQDGMTAIHDFYYLLLGSHYYDESIAEEDDWHGDISQRSVWLKTVGNKCVYLNNVDTGNSYIGACHALLEYQAMICSLLNVDFIPPSDNHASKILQHLNSMMRNTVGSIKKFQYEWFQAEVMIGAAKLCILRADIIYCKMKPIEIILKECDRLLGMLESKVCYLLKNLVSE